MHFYTQIPTFITILSSFSRKSKQLTIIKTFWSEKYLTCVSIFEKGNSRGNKYDNWPNIGGGNHESIVSRMSNRVSEMVSNWSDYTYNKNLILVKNIEKALQ